MGKTNQVQSVTGVRPQIKEMLSGGSDEDFEKSLPTSTASTPLTEEPVTKRKRRSREEMAASRGETSSATPETDPNMSDPRYRAIMEEMSSGGGTELAAFAFRASGKPLTTAERKKIDDQFYIMAKRGGWNVQSWWSIIAYFLFCVLGPIALDRTDLLDKLKELFAQAKIAPKPKPAPEVKAEEIVLPAMTPHYGEMQP